MPDEYHSPHGFVYTAEFALELTAIWDGIDAAEQTGTTLDAIERALTEDWEAAVITLARLGVRS